MKKTRLKFHEINSTNDIKYRGVLTYQHFRILGWLLIALSQLNVLLNLGNTIAPSRMPSLGILETILPLLGSIATPLLLVANFAVILSSRENFKQLLIRFGTLSAAAIAVFFLFYERYLIGFFAIDSTRSEAKKFVDSAFFEDGFFAFNLFLDLFLCTLVMFFLDYIPKKGFEGKKIIIFRLFALIPILYEAASVTLKILASLGIIKLPAALFPFLTTKPPIGFAVFVALALFIKRRERKYIKSGKTLEEYREYLNTNSNSWHFSVHAAIIMVVAAIVDFVITVILVVSLTAHYVGTEQYQAILMTETLNVVRTGFGASILLIFVAPLMLLFSYNRKPKRPQLDRYIPIGGIIMIIMVYLEGIHIGLKLLG